MFKIYLELSFFCATFALPKQLKQDKTMTYVITDYENNKWLLEEKTYKQWVYYEVFAHSEDDTYGKYIGDFECEHKFETKEFEQSFNDWLNEEIRLVVY